MEQRKPLSHIAVGLLISAIVIVFYMVMMTLAGGESKPSPGGGFLSYLIIIVGLIIFINLYAKAKDNYVSFGELFSYGFKSATVITLVMVLFMVLFSFIFPDFKTKSMEIMQTQMDSQKGIDQDKIDAMVDTYNKYFWPLIIGSTMLTYVILGAIGSLLGAAITKKRPQNPFEQQPL